MLTPSDIDALWDFDDPAGSETRLRAAVLAAEDPRERSELETHLARALGLQGRFREGHEVLDSVGAGEDPLLRARVAIERGRLISAAGSPGDALPEFELAATLADRAGSPFLRIDALHMIATVAPQLAEHVTAEALGELARIDDPRARAWTVALHHDLGRARFDAGDLEGAMEEYEAALSTAEVWGTTQQAERARGALEECRAAIEARNTAGEA